MALFASETYIERRYRLQQQMATGLVLLPGNTLSPMNYPDNAYPFRQESSFLYFLGLDRPGLFGVMDMDNGTSTIFGDDATMEESIWIGYGQDLVEQCHNVGVTDVKKSEILQAFVRTAIKSGRLVHFLPPCRPDTAVQLSALTACPLAAIETMASEPLIRAVVELRSIKSSCEIEQIEAALDVTREMHTLAMEMSKPGIYEREVMGAITGRALARGSNLSYPVIFSVHGEVLHNISYDNRMKAGDIAINDSGADSLLHYASDITRTIPVGGSFSTKQKEIYTIVLKSLEAAIEAIKPGVKFRDIHMLASLELASGLKDLGLMKGDMGNAVAAGAHTLFFPCGVGHMMGLDVHDMEGLGEGHVGYTESIKRDPRFGFRSLRLARELEPGFVITVEPGIYFIPPLMDRWRAEKKFSEFINFDTADTYRDFGGVRLEDDVLIEKEGYRVLGPPIPKTIHEVEATTGSDSF
jgi:Xaa-Pro dipeptidase